MSKPSVLVVYKRSAYTRYRERIPRVSISGPLRRVLKASHDRHHDALRRVGGLLTACGYRVRHVFRSRLGRLGDLDRRYDLVVSVGGDGTFLETSHYLDRTPLLSVNSDPEKSVARFSACDVEGLPALLERYQAGRLRPVSLSRLRLRLDGRVLPIAALNDVLVTAHCPAEASRYTLRVGGRSEEQMSSGLWISTAVGSTAANASAGGRVLSHGCRCFQYVVREIYHLKTGRRRLLNGVLRSGRLVVTSHMRDGEVYVDGANLRVPFRLGSRLEVSLSDRSLRVVGLRRCC